MIRYAIFIIIDFDTVKCPGCEQALEKAATDYLSSIPPPQLSPHFPLPPALVLLLELLESFTQFIVPNYCHRESVTLCNTPKHLSRPTALSILTVYTSPADLSVDGAD